MNSAHAELSCNFSEAREVDEEKKPDKGSRSSEKKYQQPEKGPARTRPPSSECGGPQVLTFPGEAGSLNNDYRSGLAFSSLTFTLRLNPTVVQADDLPFAINLLPDVRLESSRCARCSIR